MRFGVWTSVDEVQERTGLAKAEIEQMAGYPFRVQRDENGHVSWVCEADVAAYETREERERLIKSRAQQRLRDVINAEPPSWCPRG